ncbi:MAG: GGDEF domain-containing response regulator [Gemmatimonadetes bacterium]|nr:GGDEF domain-containing response regulator [Gemmatimonadota bacterium]
MVESGQEFLEVLRDRLAGVRSGSGIELEWAGSLSESLARLNQGGVDLVLLNPELPDSQGIVTFERTYAFAPDVPVIVITQEDDESLAVSAVQGGAQDYLVKHELTGGILARSVRHAMERHRLLSALRSLSLIDDLTQLYNRRGFADLGEWYLKLARRTARGVAVVFLDLDRFKTINASLGHHVGDRALIKIADILRATFRRSDIIGRLGGDEFAVLALEASGESSELLIERLRDRFREFNQSSKEPYQLSVSLGMARHDGDMRLRLEDLLSEADNAMYEEKRSKRRTVSRGG